MDGVAVMGGELGAGEVAMAEGAGAVCLDDVGGGVVGGDGVDYRLARGGFAVVGLLFFLDQLPGGAVVVDVVSAAAVHIGAAAVGVRLFPGLDESGLQGLITISQIAHGLAAFGHSPGDDFPSSGGFDFAHHGLLAEGFVLCIGLGMGGEFVLVVALLGEELGDGGSRWDWGVVGVAVGIFGW